MNALESIMYESATRFTFTDLAILLALVVWAISKLVPVFKNFNGERKMKNTEQKCDAEVSKMLHEVHTVITREDEYGQKIFLGIPRYLKGFVESNRKQEGLLRELVGKMTHLVNHQNDIILALGLKNDLKQVKKFNEPSTSNSA